MVEDGRLSDEDLRELRRQALAHPGDAPALRALAGALERAGDRRGAFLALCELARTGDHAAQQRVLGWSPWSHHGHAQRSRRAGIDGAPRVDVSAPIGQMGRLTLASDERCFGFDGRGRATAVWPDLSPSWAFSGDELDDPAGLRVALCGDDVLCAARGRLLLLDGARGVLRAEAASPGRLLQLDVRADRLVAIAADEDDPEVRSVLALDLGARFGRVLWRDSASGFVDQLPVLGGRWAWLARSREQREDIHTWGFAERVAARRVETGEELPVAALPGDGWWRACCADERGAVVVSLDRRQLLELSAWTGDPVWWARLEEELLDWALGSECLLLTVQDPGRDRQWLLALSRADGRERWRVALPPPPARLNLALADDTAYVSTSDPSPTVLGVALSDPGRVSFELDLAEYVSGGRAGEVCLLPLERALVFEVWASNVVVARGRLHE